MCLVTTLFTCGLAHSCFITVWMGTLTCFGTNVTEFVAFHESSRESVGHMDILNTSLTSMPNLTLNEWPNLYSVNIRYNAFINCSEILDFQHSFPQLLILTDCDDHFTETIEHPEDEKNPLLYLVLGGLPCVCISLVVYFKMSKRLIYKGVKCNTRLSSTADVEV